LSRVGFDNLVGQQVDLKLGKKRGKETDAVTELLRCFCKSSKK
jgi:hypothetical protein